MQRILRLTMVFLLFVAAVPLFGSNARIVRLSFLDGDVDIDRGGTSGLDSALLNMPVTQGTRIVTYDENSRVEIEFENGSTMRLAGAGEVDFRDLSLNAEGGKVTLVTLARGTAYFNLKLKRDDDFRVDFNDENIALRKSSRLRVRATDDRVDISVYKGEAELRSRSGEVSVKKNETLSLDRNESGRYFLAKSIDTVEFDDFNRQRDEYLERAANSEIFGYSQARYGGPYTYGMSDLAYYGRYSYFPGYGYLWRPFDAGFGWDPFSNGLWSYYGGSGWVFVSRYPWGWTPYRYGNWLFVNGVGWCWQPGSYGFWQPIPRVASGPPNYRPPRPPDARPGPGTRPPMINVDGRPVPRIPGRAGEDVDRRWPRGRRQGDIEHPDGTWVGRRPGDGRPNVPRTPVGDAVVPSGSAIPPQRGGIPPAGGAIVPPTGTGIERGVPPDAGAIPGRRGGLPSRKFDDVPRDRDR